MRRAGLLCLILAGASLSIGCLRGPEECRTFADTPRVIHQYARAEELAAMEALVAKENWTVREDRYGATERVYASFDDAHPRLVFAYYRRLDSSGSAIEVYALNVSSDSDARTRELLAAAAPTLSALNATLGAPTEVKIEGLARQCASKWVPEGCEPGARKTSTAPWEVEPPTSASSPIEDCRALMVD